MTFRATESRRLWPWLKVARAGSKCGMGTAQAKEKGLYKSKFNATEVLTSYSNKGHFV